MTRVCLRGGVLRPGVLREPHTPEMLLFRNMTGATPTFKLRKVAEVLLFRGNVAMLLLYVERLKRRSKNVPGTSLGLRLM